MDLKNRLQEAQAREAELEQRLQVGSLAGNGGG
jgi:hypothetical protein